MRIIPLLAVLLTLFCAQPIENDNVYDPLSDSGDYTFSASLEGVTDTVYAGVRYPLDIANSGSDRYSRFRISSRHSRLTDNSSTEIIDEPGFIAFKHTGICTLLVRAVRMNGNEDTTELVYTVKNPYRITLDSAAYLTGKTALFQIRNSAALGSPDSLRRVSWYSSSHYGTSGKSELPLNLPHKVSLDLLPDTIRVSAVVKDSSGLLVQLDTISIPVSAQFIPQVWFPQKRMNVTINSPAQVAVEVNNADSLVWTRSTGGDTTTVTPHITMIWTDDSIDTLIVTAKNRFGTLGTRDTILVEPRLNRYGLKIISFPGSVYAGEYGLWQVVATENNVETTDDEVSYHWEFGREYTMIRDISDKGVVSVMYAKPVTRFMISVTAYKGTDSSYTYSGMVTIDSNRPVLTVAVQKDTLSIDEKVLVTVHAHDVNSSGSVKAVYYKKLTGDTAVTLLTKDTVGFSFAEAGSQRVRFWCVDNSNFVSDTVVKTFHVKSTHPYFVNRIDSVYGFAGDTITICAPAQTDRPGDSIVEWLWYTGSVEKPFRVTTKAYIDTVIPIAGTINVKVHCTSAAGESTDNDAAITVRISQGYPHVERATVEVPVKVYVNDTIMVHVAVRDSNPDGMVSLVYVCIADDTIGTVEVTPPSRFVDTTVAVALPAVHGVYGVTIVALDNDNNVSPPHGVDDSIRVLEGKPAVKKITPDTCWVNDPVRYTVSAIDENSERSLHYFVRFDTTGAFTAYAMDSIFTHAFTTARLNYLQCYVVDNDGVSSDTLLETVVVSDGAPHITEVETDTAANRIFVKDPVSFTLTVFDPNDDSVHVWISWNGDTVPEIDQQVSTDNVAFSHAFGYSDTGSMNVRLRVSDRDGLSHDTTITLEVKSGAPVVGSIVADTCEACLFVADDIPFKIFANDDNGVLKKIYVNWNGGTSVQDSITVPANTRQVAEVIRHRYGTGESGTKTVAAWAVDEDGVVSKVMKQSFNISKGTPVLTAAWCDSAPLWVKDRNRFFVNAHDANGTIVALYANWNGGTTPSETLSVAGVAAPFFTHGYDTTGGSRTARFWAVDEDGVVSLPKDTTFTVRKGTPVITKTNIDTVWVNDTNSYTIPAYDTNGTIVKRSVDWDTNGVWDDSITSGEVFSHVWDTSFGGKIVAYRVQVMDDDSIISTKVCRTFVRMGRPVVKAGATYGNTAIQWVGDTLFFIDRGATPSFAVDTTDSNGVIQKIYWDIARDGVNDSTAAPSWSQYLPQGIATPFRVIAKDDDGLKSAPFDFYVFPDAPPDTPKVVNPPLGDVATGLTIRWKNQDAKDGTATRYQLLIGYDGEDPSTELVAFKTGTDFTIVNNEFRHTFTPASTWFKIQIVAKDARGSTTPSTILEYQY